ncbi:MAG: PD-(D/E)XK nuclease family protein [Candidatus Heimdallarchaeaceae archaeon]
MLIGARIDITDVAEDDKCDRKPHMAVLLRLNNLKKYFEEEYWVFTGKFLHEILQSTFSFDYSLVEYYYYRHSLSVGDAILSTMNQLKQRWIEILYEKNENYPWFNNYTMQGKIKEALKAGIPILARLSETLIDVLENGKIVSNVIGTEYKVDLALTKRYSLVGRIDLLVWGENREKIRVIELKTGSKYLTDESQVLTYAEIIRRERPDLVVIPELWYTKGNMRCKIKYPKLTDKNKELKRIRKVITVAERAKTEEDIPPMTDNDFKCREFCRMCLDHMDTIFPEDSTTEIKKTTGQQNLKDYFG